MTKLVLDCSAAVNIVRQTPEGLQMACTLAMPEIDEVLAPQLFFAEAASALSKYHRAGLMDDDEVQEATDNAVGLVNTFVPHEDLYVESLSESLRLKHSVYDMFYLVLARRRGAILLTNDARLRALCRENGVKSNMRAKLKSGHDPRELGAWEFE